MAEEEKKVQESEKQQAAAKPAEAPAEKKENIWTKTVSPVVGYCTFFGALVLAIGIGLLVCLL